MTRQQILERLHRLAVRAALLAREAWRRLAPMLRAGWAATCAVAGSSTAFTVTDVTTADASPG